MRVIDRFAGPYAFLSNFYVYDGTTLEHQFQACKTVDPVWQERILSAATPGEAKRLGRQAPLRPRWNEIRTAVMFKLLIEKFAHPILASRLDATGDAQLIEGNTWHDQFWGDCRCGRAACASPGLNMLGELLMLVRAPMLHR